MTRNSRVSDYAGNHFHVPGVLMRLPLFLIALLLAVHVNRSAWADGVAASKTATRSDQGWIQLFDGKSLHGWYTKIQNQKTNEDPEKYFQVDDGVIHVYKDQAAGVAVPNGYLATEAVYANYH